MRKLKSKEVQLLAKGLTATKETEPGVDLTPEPRLFSQSSCCLLVSGKGGDYMIFFLSLTTDLISDESHFTWMGCKKVGGGWSFPDSKVVVIQGRIHCLFFPYVIH